LPLYALGLRIAAEIRKQETNVKIGRWRAMQPGVCMGAVAVWYNTQP